MGDNNRQLLLSAARLLRPLHERRTVYPTFSTVHTLAQMGPPILNVAAARGFRTCTSTGARPSSWSALQPIMAIPVAPMGCPLAISPPEVLMAHSPSGAALPSTQYWAPLPGSALPITSVPSAPITVKQSCTSATLTSSGLTCAISYAARMARYAPAGCSTSRPALRMGSVACPHPATSTHSDWGTPSFASPSRSEEHTSELQ